MEVPKKMPILASSNTSNDDVLVEEMGCTVKAATDDDNRSSNVTLMVAIQMLSRETIVGFERILKLESGQPTKCESSTASSC